MNAYQRQFISLLLIVLLGLVACRPAMVEEAAEPFADPGERIDEPPAALANPAAVYCEGVGYRLEPRATAAGLDAVCIFPDGSECWQWDFLAGRCGQEYAYCFRQGGIRLEANGDGAVCVFADGSTCAEQQLFAAECRPGDNPSAVEAADGEPLAAAAPRVAVAGWMGYVASTPAGAQFDDYVVILPEGEIGAFGIEGVKQAVREQIVALRDREQPGKYAHFWGTLTCDVPDYGGCQLLVDEMLVDGSGEIREHGLVEGWTGTMVAYSYVEPGAPQPDDAFILGGAYALPYGIDSAMGAISGERDLREVIASLTESEAEVTIWGEMACGVPDAGGCHIEVARIATGGSVYEINPG